MFSGRADRCSCVDESLLGERSCRSPAFQVIVGHRPTVAHRLAPKPQLPMAWPHLWTVSGPLAQPLSSSSKMSPLPGASGRSLFLPPLFLCLCLSRRHSGYSGDKVIFPTLWVSGLSSTRENLGLRMQGSEGRGVLQFLLAACGRLLPGALNPWPSESPTEGQNGPKRPRKFLEAPDPMGLC
jgi:hypothetical protein